MNLQNGTLDTRLPQNIIRNFEIPANVEHDKLNPFKIGGGNAIWATHLPPNVNVWFSTNPNFDNAQKLDYMNRGMRFMSIGSDGLQQQYDNFYIFTEGKWDDTIKIAVSSQGDMVEPILSSNTGDIENVGRVASISKMPVNGASGYNVPDFNIWCKNKIAGRLDLQYNFAFFQKMEYDILNFLEGKKYLFEIQKIWQNCNLFYTTAQTYDFNYTPSFLAFGFLKLSNNLKAMEFDENIDKRQDCNIEPFFLYRPQPLPEDPAQAVTDEIKPSVSLPELIKTNELKIIDFITFQRGMQTSETFLNKSDVSKIILDGKDIKGIPIILINSLVGGIFSGFFDFNVRIYSL